MLAVLAGGFLGAAARELVAQALPHRAGTLPWATLAVNLSGALVLGALLEALVRAGEDTGIRRRIRLTAGTGFLGAFTTYSTFAVESDLLIRAGHGAAAVAYLALTVVGGLAAVVAGVAAGAARGRLTLRELPVDPDVGAGGDSARGDGP